MARVWNPRRGKMRPKGKPYLDQEREKRSLANQQIKKRKNYIKTYVIKREMESTNKKEINNNDYWGDHMNTKKITNENQASMNNKIINKQLCAKENFKYCIHSLLSKKLITFGKLQPGNPYVDTGG